MQADFTDANERHWLDAELLLAGERWANADHLYGFSAECGLKALMVAFGMPCHADGRPRVRDDRQHIDQLSARYEAYRSGGAFAVYCCDAVDAFVNWQASDRYANQAEFNANHVALHRNAAQAIRTLLKTARREGVIE